MYGRPLSSNSSPYVDSINTAVHATPCPPNRFPASACQGSDPNSVGEIDIAIPRTFPNSDIIRPKILSNDGVEVPPDVQSTTRTQRRFFRYFRGSNDCFHFALDSKWFLSYISFCFDRSETRKEASRSTKVAKQQSFADKSKNKSRSEFTFVKCIVSTYDKNTESWEICDKMV